MALSRTRRLAPRRRLCVEALEQRIVFAAPPVGIGPLPSVTVGLTADQLDNADAVINWHTTALRASWTAASSPIHASRVYAMVTVAMYDAVNAITPVGAAYPIPGLTGKPAPKASAEAAAIAAAETVLRSLYPAQSALFDEVSASTLANVPGGVTKTRGIEWGQKVGEAMLAWRAADDVRPTVPEYTPGAPGGTPGEYQLTPGATFALAPQWGNQATWALTSGEQFLPPPPPALDSPQYAADFNEVKALGILDSPARTADQSEIAHFWSDVPTDSAAPPGHVNEIAQRIALIEDLSLAENARLFAMLNLGLADAAINSWEAKYAYNFWRPVTAIRDSRAGDLNPLTEADPTWTPQWASPSFPSYTSGHSTFSGTGAAILTALFGPDYQFTMGSDDMPGVVRSFDNFLEAAQEAADSRLYGGIHFRFDNEAGLIAGLNIGNYVAQNFLQPLTATAFLQIDPNDPNRFNLAVVGTDRRDGIVLDLVGSQIIVRDHGRSLGSFDADVSGIFVDARGGNDVVLLDDDIQIDATIFGGSGNDLLVGGSGDDTIDGGSGRDLIFGGDGDDHLVGGEGIDFLFGLLGDDSEDDLFLGGQGRKRLPK